MPLKRVALTLLCALLLVAAWQDVEHLLNGPPPADARFDLALSITATLTQMGDYYGDAPFSATGLPFGVTATISNVSKVNRVTTSKLTLRVANDVALATYVLVVQAHSEGWRMAWSVWRAPTSQPPSFLRSKVQAGSMRRSRPRHRRTAFPM